MSLASITKFALASNPMLMLKVQRTLTEFFRATFVSTLAAEGIGAQLASGPKTAAALCEALGMGEQEAELRSWLDMGVGMGELGRDERGYRLKGALATKLSDPDNDHVLAFTQARVEVLYQYLVRTPGLLRAGERMPLDDDWGELFARSSRTVEPLMLDIVDKVVPATGALRLLEVGCGSGVYVRRACERNPALQVVGLELTPVIADFARANLEEWGLADRVTVESTDVRDYPTGDGFDRVTLYNLLYYFPHDQRVALMRKLRDQLRPEGALAMVSLTPGTAPMVQSMDLWSTMTEGCGPLPRADEVPGQLAEAGFGDVTAEALIPGYYLWLARRPA